MNTKITATFNDGDESTTRTITLPHDVDDRVGELIGLGLLAEHTVDCDAFNVEVHHDEGSTSSCDYAVGDTIEVTGRPHCYTYGPPAGHRAAVVEVSDFGTLCIPWDAEGPDGFWLSYDQVRRVNEPAAEPAPDYRIGDTVNVSSSSAWTTGGRGTVVEIDDDEDNFTPVCVECEGQRWWVSGGCVKRVESSKSVRDFYINDRVKVMRAYDVKLVGRQGRVSLLRPQPEGVLVQFGMTGPDVWLSPAPDLHVSPSIWSAPTIAPDGTKTFTAPGVTCVEHPPTAEDGFPTWTITAELTKPAAAVYRWVPGMRALGATEVDAGLVTDVSEAGDPKVAWRRDESSTWVMSRSFVRPDLDHGPTRGALLDQVRELSGDPYAVIISFYGAGTDWAVRGRDASTVKNVDWGTGPTEGAAIMDALTQLAEKAR